MGRNYQEIVERAGAKFIRCERGEVFFADSDGNILRLYDFALRSVEDVTLAIKCARERILDFAFQ